MISKELTDSIKNATIDELMGKLEYCGHDGYYNELYYPVIKEIKRRLKEPKEQPEIIRCKDCKYRDDDDFCIGRGYPNTLVPDDGFCDKGERREE